MKINLKVFSSVKIICGFSEKQIEIKGSTVDDVLQFLFINNNELASIKGKLLFAVNEEYCDKNRILRDGDTLAIFPPVSGG